MNTQNILSAINMNQFNEAERKQILLFIDNAAEIEKVKLDLMTSKIAAHSAEYSGYENTEIEMSIEQLTAKLSSLKKNGDQLFNSITGLIPSRTGNNQVNSFNSNDSHKEKREIRSGNFLIDSALKKIKDEFSFGSNQTQPLTYEFSTDTRTPAEINAKQIKLYEEVIAKGNQILEKASKNLKKMEEELARLEATKISLAISIENKAYSAATQKVAVQKNVINKQRILIGDILESIKEAETKIQSLKSKGELIAIG